MGAAQDYMLPRPAFQPGALYFTSEMKCCVLGMRDLVSGKQMNYFCPEGSFPFWAAAGELALKAIGCKKGSHVVSILDHYIKNYAAIDETTHTLYLTTDNAANNKNYAFIAFLAFALSTRRWGVALKRVEFVLLIAGHTKFELDGCFGTLKRQLARQDILSALDVQDTLRARCVLLAVACESANLT